MGANHQGGNIQPGLDLEEHDGAINAKRVSLASAATIFVVSNVGSAQLSGSVTVGSLVSAATIYAVVNTSAAGVGESMVTLFPSPNFIGITTVANKDRTITGNITISDSKAFIGLTTSVIGSAIPAGANFIGLVTVVGSLSPAAGNVTLDAGSKTGIVGNVTISDSKGYIGLVTATLDNSRGVSFSGNVTLDAGSKTGIIGNVTLSDSKNFIGLVTVVQSSAARTITGNLTLSDSKTFIGLTTTTIGAAIPAGENFIGLVTIVGSLAPASGNVTLDAGSKTQIVGNVTISDSKGFIGLVSVSGFANPLPVTFSGNVTLDSGSKTQVVGNLTISDSKAFIGLVTAVPSTTVRSISGNVTLSDAKTYIGLVTATIGGTPNVAVVGNVTLSDAKTFIGLVTVGGIGTVTLADPKGFIGLATTVNGAGTQFIGLVTAWSRNAGTTKTLIPLSLAMSTSSVVTVVVPTGGNAIFNVTKLLLNSNATVGLTIKSGVTYLIGNASLAVNLNPGGGWVETGSPDSPVYIGLASGAAIVLEKRDSAAAISQIGGSLVYFAE